MTVLDNFGNFIIKTLIQIHYSCQATVQVSTPRCGFMSSYQAFLLFVQGNLCINFSNRLSHKDTLNFNNDNLLTKSQYLVS